MKVTNVFINKLSGGKVKAFADVEFDNVLIIKGFALFPGRDGEEFSVQVPKNPDKNGRKDEETGALKYWPTIKIDMKTVEGREFMGEISRAVIQKYQGAPANGVPQLRSTPELVPDYEDDVPF